MPSFSHPTFCDFQLFYFSPVSQHNVFLDVLYPELRKDGSPSIDGNKFPFPYLVQVMLIAQKQESLELLEVAIVALHEIRLSLWTRIILSYLFWVIWNAKELAKDRPTGENGLRDLVKTSVAISLIAIIFQHSTIFQDDSWQPFSKRIQLMQNKEVDWKLLIENEESWRLVWSAL